MTSKLAVVLLLLVAAPPLSGAAPASWVSLEIRHLWDGKEIEIPSAALARGGGESLALTRLAYLLSEPSLAQVQDDGAAVQWLGRKQWFAFVDGADGVAEVVMRGLPRAQYAGLKFHVGLDEETNAGDPNQYGPNHPLNPVLNNLHWSWQGGYIFLAVEGRQRDLPSHKATDRQAVGSGGASREAIGFSYHLGNAPSRMAVELPVDLDLTSRDAVIALDFHLDRVFGGDKPIDIAAQTSTHGREGDALARDLKDRIEKAFTVREIRYRDAPTAGSTVMTAPHEAESVGFTGTPYRFTLKKGFPIPPLPLDYPLTNERVALGEKLFHETLLSRDNTLSCASCHQSASAFSDPRRYSVGVDGQEGTRNAMPIFNLAWKDSFFWDGRAPSLRAQALIPIEDPVEMHETLDHVVEELAAHDEYPALFKDAFDSEAITAEKLGIAIEQFVLTLTSLDSRFDRAMKGQEDTLTEQEKRGFELFFTEHDPRRQLLGADCFHCHGGAFFTDHRFHNNGLPATGDRGLEEITGKASDRGKFSTPSLRNVALTAPYMHDGRFATLEEVLSHYAGGIVRSETLDPNLAKHPGGGVPLSEEDQAAVVAFLRTLTDEKFLGNNKPVAEADAGRGGATLPGEKITAQSGAKR